MSTKTAPELPLATTAAQILAATDTGTEPEPVAVPEWGVRLLVKGLSGTERDKYQSDFYTFGPTDKGGMRITRINSQNQMARLVALSVVDPDGKRLFSEADVVALGNKSAVGLERVNDVAMRLSGLQAAAAEALKEGLKETQNGSHGSD